MTWNNSSSSSAAVEAESKEKELFDWLHTLELGHYFDKFVDHGYDDLEICMEIGEVDLHAIGVSDIHERLALLQAVRQLRQQQQQQEKDKCQINNTKKRAKDNNVSSTSASSSSSSQPQSSVHAISPLVDDNLGVSSPSILMPPVTSSLYSSWNTSNNPPTPPGRNQNNGGNSQRGKSNSKSNSKNPFAKGNKEKNNKNASKGLEVNVLEEQNLSDFSNYHHHQHQQQQHGGRLGKPNNSLRQFLGGGSNSGSTMLDSFPVETTFQENVINGYLLQQQQQQQRQRYRTVVDHQNYVDVNDGDENSEPIYESVSPVHYPMNKSNCRSTPITPRHGSARTELVHHLQQHQPLPQPPRYEKSHQSHHHQNHHPHHRSREDEESLSSGCYAAPTSLTTAASAGGITGSGQPANLTRLKAQLRDQVMQDGINMSRIQDEGILRNMAAQYAAELASTLTLTPSSTSACSSASDSSVLACSSSSSSSSAGSSSVQTPADAHYQQVFQQLRELWLEERMKLFPMPAAFMLDDCACGGGGSNSESGGNNRRNHSSTMTPHRLKSSCSSTPAATTPSGCCPCDGITMGNSANGGGGALLSFPSARSVPCLLHHPSCNNNGSPGVNNLINNSNSPCKSPERQAQQQHQYLQHVIISNSSFNNQQQQSTQSAQSNNTANINVPKQTYTPGIYQPSSCLLDKDDIYDYAPPVRYSPQRTVVVTMNNNRNNASSSSSHSSPTKRCFSQPKGSEKFARNANGISTVRGASRSSYTLATSANGNNGNYDTLSAGRAGGGKQGCRTLANLSKLSRRLGLSRFFRTLKIHGNETTEGGGGSQGESNGGTNGGANSQSICRCYQSNLNSELTSLCQCQYGSGGFSRNTLPDLAAEAANGNSSTSSKGSMSSLPSNERIIQTINRLKLEELQKRKERIAQEHQMVRDTLFYMLPRNT